MGNFDITSRDISRDVVLVKTASMLDNNNAHEMVEMISAIQSRGVRNIVVDMADLDFISSAGVGSILGTVEGSRELGGDIIIAGASETIIHVFRVLDLLDYLTIKPSVQEALAFCGVKSSV